MKQSLYTVRDNKLNVSVTIFPAANNLTAMRSFEDFANTPGNPINKHPSDYTLHFIGTWDDDADTLTDATNETLATAEEYINEPPS